MKSEDSALEQQIDLAPNQNSERRITVRSVIKQKKSVSREAVRAAKDAPLFLQEEAEVASVGGVELLSDGEEEQQKSEAFQERNP